MDTKKQKNLEIKVKLSSHKEVKTILTKNKIHFKRLLIQKDIYYKVERGTGRDETGLMNFGMDVEFKIDALTGKLYIKQARSL